MFRILYIEDEPGYARQIEEAVKAYNAKTRSNHQRQMFIGTIRSPDKTFASLSDQYDLVLADVFYPDKNKVQVPRLAEIIAEVKRWCQEHNLGKTIPIIAYSGHDGDELEVSLQSKDELYDIWDKSSATPAYVAWRLAKLAVELSQVRPDALLERLIRTMDNGASWHDLVLQMATKYGSGLSEADQISKAGEAIADIGYKLGVRAFATRSWEIMELWEPLGRAVSPKVRGHARHVVNVYWLGYHLLHHNELKAFFSRAWKTLLVDRGGMAEVRHDDPLECLSSCWYYAGLFHDFAQAVEKNGSVGSRATDVLGKFNGVTHTAGTCTVTDKLLNAADALFKKLGAPTEGILRPHWEASVKSGKPDHGVVAAVDLVNAITDERQQCFAREGARAMLIHNLIGAVEDRQAPFLVWERDPITCLLLLCDQIQTWDRDRDDPKAIDEDQPERAALSELTVSNAKRPNVELWIEYNAPRHLDHAPVVFERLKTKLKKVLQTKPAPVLHLIKAPWPFSGKIEFRLAGQSLDSRFEFPSSVGKRKRTKA